MSWTLDKWTNLYAVSALALVAIKGCSAMPYAFMRMYERARRRYVTAGPPSYVFRWAWTLIGVMLIAGTVLYAINYQACNNTYYLITSALILAHFALLCGWSMAFWGAKSAVGGFIMLVLVLGTGIGVVVMLGLTGGSTCATNKTEAWVAFGLWCVPLIWYIWAAVMNWQWMQIPTRALERYARMSNEMPLTENA